MNEISTTQHQSRWRSGFFLWAALIGIAAFVGYQQIFSTFAEYDDEGYVMMSLRSFMNGQALYDETFSQYGPAFYLVESSIQRVLGLPITHEIVRLKTVAKWLIVAGACAWFVGNLTRQDGKRSRPLSILTFCLVFLHLDRLCLEPGHPQELCALGIAGCLALSVALSSTETWKRIIASGLMGLVCATIVLTKLNVGLFLIASTISALVLLLPSSKLKNCLIACTYAGLGALPLLLYRQHLLEIESGLLAVMTALAGIAAVYICQSNTESKSASFGWKELVSYSVAGFVTTAAVLIWTLSAGTSNEGLLYGLIKQHTGFQHTFFHQPPVSAVLVAVGALITAYGWRSRANSFFAAGLVILGCLVAYLTETWQPLKHGLVTRGRADLLMSVGPGLVLLFILANRPNKEFAPRVLLAFTALLQPLAAYPTPGTQTAVGSFGFIAICVLLLNDGMRELSVKELRVSPQLKALGTLVAAATCVLAARSVVATDYRSQLTPLAMPGAERLRLDPEFVDEQQWIVSELQKRSDTFVFGEQGLNCLYFWTEIEPPTGLNTTFWPFIMRESDQAKVVKALEGYPNACVARTKFDAPLPSGLLSRYIADNFHPAAAQGRAEIWVRNEQTVDVGIEPTADTSGI